MKNPCNECLVKTMCSSKCRKSAEYIFTTGSHPEISNLKEMTHEDAIQFILMAENMAIFLEKNLKGTNDEMY